MNIINSRMVINIMNSIVNIERISGVLKVESTKITLKQPGKISEWVLCKCSVELKA